MHRKRSEMQHELNEMREQLEKEKRAMEQEFERVQMKRKIFEKQAHPKKFAEKRTEKEERLKQQKRGEVPT